MFKKFLTIEGFEKDDFKNIYEWRNTNCYLLELYSKKELRELNKDCEYVHNVMSYGEGNYIGRFITTPETIKLLALNDKINKLTRENIKKDKKGNIIEVYSYTQSVCLVENKTQYYKMFYDFDYKYEKYPEIYAGFENQHDTITKYILNLIKETIDETIYVTKKDLEYIWAGKNKSHGHHIYFPHIVTDKILHFYIYSKTLEKIIKDKKYPINLINQIFDDCVGKANGLRLFYYKCNGDFYYPIKEKSTFEFEPEPQKHFSLCLINTDLITYNFNLKIEQDIITGYSQETNNKQKAKDIKNGVEINELDYITDFKILDIEDKKELLIGLTNILNIERIDKYNDWLRLVYIHKNYGLYDEIIALSKKSEKYNNKAIQTINDIFADNKTIKNQITIGTLIKWAQEDNIGKTNVLIAKYHLSLKLNIKSIDEILLSYYNIKPDYIESSQYISKTATELFIQKINDKDKNIEVLILMSPTGTGKTTVINKIIKSYLEKYPGAKILSVITRRSMSACHISAFNNDDSEVLFTSYLDDKYDTLDYFISSLEYLAKVADTYDFIILDEVNSLINYFYSSTLQDKRLQCLVKLVELIRYSNFVVAVDANITDLVFTLFKQLNKKYFFYQNTFQNKKDVPMNIYYSQIHNEDNNLISYCNEYIIPKYISKGKSCLILTDSKEVTDKLKLVFQKHNTKEDYYRIFTREEGTLEDMKNINKVGVKRLILSSPKILYGLDLTIPYDETFMIYRRNSGLMSMGALEMIQQISRARNTKAVNILILDPNAKFAYNKYISYDQNKKIQDKIISGNLKYHDELCKKYEVVNLLGCVEFDVDGIIKFKQNSFMTQIHYLKTWYDQLFYRNKVDIIKLIAKDYGYKINDINWNPEVKNTNLLKDALKLKKDEIIAISKKICLNKINEIDNKYKYYIENLKEQVKIREKYLTGVEDIDLYLDLASDHEKFINWLNKKYLYLSKENFNKKIIDINNNDFIEMNDDKDIINKINTCFWFEELLNFNRFKIEEIVCDNIDNIKKIFNQNIDKLYFIFKINKSKEKIIKSIKHKIESILNLNYLQKFIAECYNNVVEDTFKYEYLQTKINKKLVGSYKIIKK